MWNVKEITADNFMSYETVSFSFDTGCTVIKAENFDDEGQESNGGGKTSFIDVFPVCLLGQSLTGRALKDCVKWNTTKNYFEVGCVLEHVDGRVAEIKRKVYNNTKSAELYITVNGEAPKGIPRKDDKIDVLPGNKWILEELLDISKEDLLGYYLISPQYYNSYFKASAKAKVDIINRFSNADKVDMIIDDLKAKVKGQEGNVAQANMMLENQNNQLVQLRQELEDAEGVKPIQSAESVLQEYEEKQKELEVLQERLTHFQSITPELQAAQQKEQQINGKLSEQRTQLVETNQLIKELEIKLSGILECPNCQFKFSPTSEVGVDVMQESVDQLKKMQEIITQGGQSEKANLASVQQEIGVIQANISAARSNIQTQVESLRTQISGLKGKAEMILAEQEKSKNIANKIELLLEQMGQTQSGISDIQEDYEKNQQWHTYFEDFKFYLANKPIKIISSFINHYLKENKSDMLVHIEGFKKLKSGKIKQQLNPVVYKGTDGYDYNTFSGGERVRLNISADLAFQELINNGSKSGGLNFYCNDELLNSLDSLGISNAAHAFDQVKKTILLVSHSGADLHYSKIVTIKKENGNSTLS